MEIFKQLFINNLFYFSATILCNSLGCQHKCQASPAGGVCSCPEGRILANDSRSCIGKIINHDFQDNIEREKGRNSQYISKV